MKQVLALILLLFSTFCLASTFETNKLQTSYKNTPTFYSNSIYVHNEKNNISKLSFSGTEDWQLEPAITVKQFQLHFNKLYSLDKQGVLSRVDAIYGFSEWSYELTPVHSFRLSTPFIIVQNADKTLSCIDSNSGHLLWSQKKFVFDHYERVGRSAFVVGLTKNTLKVLDVITGDVVATKKLPKKKLKIIGTNNSSLFLEKGKSLYEFDLSKSEFTKIEGNVLNKANKVMGPYYYSKEDKKIKFYKFNLEDPLWTIHFDQSIKKIFYYPEYFVVQLSETQFQVYDSLTGHTMTEIFEVSLEDPEKSSFYPNNDQVIILDKTTIYTVKRVKS